MLPRTRAILERGIIGGEHIGAQVYVSRRGKVVAELAIGESRPGVPMTTDSLLLWLSSTKPVGAVAALQLVERGQLALDDPVARYIPEFAQHGKESITVRHLLTHTGGFRWVDVGPLGTPWDEIIARICQASLERGWIPGQKAGYHPFTSWYILGELVRRVDGRTYSQYVRDEIFEPLGMRDSWVGMPAQRYRAYGNRIGLLLDTQAKSKPATETPVHRYSTEQGACDCVPGGNGYGPVRELGMFYEMLLGRGGVRILAAQSVAQMIARQREGLYDETFKHVIDWGLGVILDSKRYGADSVPYGYGPHASPETFGHGGSQSSVGLADPAHQLVVAAVMNGTPGEPRHQRRLVEFCAAVYEDLGLSGGVQPPASAGGK